MPVPSIKGSLPVQFINIKDPMPTVCLGSPVYAAENIKFSIMVPTWL